MSDDTWKRAREVFDAVCDLGEPAREAAIAAACHGDSELEQAVRAMLASDAAPDPWLDAPPDQGLLGLLARDMGAPVSGEVPTRIGGYEIVRRIGAGSMGVVFEAEQQEPRRRVALKTIHAWLSSRYVVDRFREEIGTLATFAHPAIPQIHEAGSDDGRAWLAMELVRGRSLADSARDDAQRAELLARVCDGVEVAHRHGVVHRDLKPSNLLVTADGQPKILDFGLASRLSDEAVPTGGTTAYMSPEALEGSAGVRADVYALGVIGWELFTGRLPVEGESLSRSEITRRKREWRAQLVPGHVDEDLAAVLGRATAAEPEARYPSAAAFASDLRAWAAALPVSARPWTPWHAAVLWTRRHRRISYGSAAVAVAASLVAVGGAVQSRYEHAQIDAAAADRWQIASAEIARLEDAGRPEEAEAAFRAFVSLAGSHAMSRAWLERAGMHRDRGRHDQASTAFVEAYHTATDDDSRRAALVGLAGELADRWRWNELALVADRLAPLDPAAAAEAGARAAFGSRRFDPVGGGDDARRALAKVWSQATPTPYVPYWVHVVPDGILFSESATADRLVLARPEPTLQPIAVIDGLAATMRTDNALPHVARATSGAWKLVGRLPDGRVAIWRLDAGRLVEEQVWDNESPVDVTFADAFSDGTERLLVGMGGISRRLVASSGTGPVPAARELDGLGSDISTVVATDLDGDGTDEVVVGAGPWYAYAVVVLEPSPDGLVVRDLARIGNVTRLVKWHDGLIATIVGELDNADAWGPSGGPLPPGVAWLRWRDGHLVVDGHWPVPSPAGVKPVLSIGSPVVGDFDGDGRADLGMDLATSPHHQGWFLLARDEGFVSLTVEGVFPLAATNLDDDPADELIVSLPEDGYRTWVLGAGADVLPPLPAMIRRGTPPRGLDPAMVAAWDTAEEIALFGRPADAARSLLAAAASTTKATDSAPLLQEAGDLAAAAKEDDLALEAWERASEAGSSQASERMLTLLDDRHRFADAAAARVRLGRPTEAVPVWRMDPAAPLEDWRIVEPLGIRRAIDGGVEVDAFAGLGTLATLPVTGAGPVAVEATLDLDRVEIGAGLTIGMRNDRGDWVASVDVTGSGGGPLTWQFFGCGSLAGGGTMSSRIAPLRSAVAGFPVRLRASYDPRSGVRTCEAWIGDGPPVTATGTQPPSGLPVEVAIVTAGELGLADAVLARARITALSIEGVTPVEEPRPGWGQTPPLSSSALAAIELGDPDAVARAIGRMLAHPQGRELVPLLLRAHPEEIGAAMEGRTEAERVAVLRQAWGIASRYSADGEVVRALLLPAIGSLDPADALSRRILLSRARLALAAGRPEQARREAERIVAAVDGPDRDAADADLLLATLAMEAGDRDAAKADAARFVEQDVLPALARERLAHTPLLAPLLDDL